MASETIGTGQDRSNIATWEANQTANGTGTCTVAEQLDTAIVTLNAPYTLLLTADATAAVAAPSISALTSGAYINCALSRGFEVTAGSWTIEKIGITAGEDGISVQVNGTVVRRCVTATTGTGYYAIRNDGGTGVVLSNLALIGYFGLRNAGSVTLYHCSMWGSNNHAALNKSGATGVAYACVAQGGGGFTNEGDPWTGDYNVSPDATAPGSSSTKYIRSESGWFANTGSGVEDLALHADKQGYWVAQSKDAIDQTGWPADVATDIVGTTRAAPIDPGVWQTPAAAPAANHNNLLLLGVG